MRFIPNGNNIAQSIHVHLQEAEDAALKLAKRHPKIKFGVQQIKTWMTATHYNPSSEQ